jgi:hypothetical protein
MRRAIALLAGLALVAALAPSVAAAPPGVTKAADLFAGQSTDVGDVFVWNDSTSLYIEIDLVAGWCMTESHVAVASAPEGIPQTKTGNPIPGKFAYGDTYDPCADGDEFTVPLSGLDATPVIAVHAKVWDESQIASMNVFSDSGNTTVTASTAGGTLPRPAVDAWEAFLDPVDATPSTWDNGVGTSTFALADWIWSDYRVNTPTVDETATFVRTFTVPGPVAPGSWMKVTADDAYTAGLNGSLVASDTWPNWPSVESANPFVPVMGPNTLGFVATNSNVSNGSGGTIDNNPGGLIYEARINYYTHSESAWAGEPVGFTQFTGANWATYFGYGVQAYVFGDTVASTDWGVVNLDFEVWGGSPAVGTTSWARTTGSVNAWEGPVVSATIGTTTASFTVRVATGTPAGIDGCDITIAVSEGGAGIGTWNITTVVNSPAETCPYAGQIQGPSTITSGYIDVFLP